MHNKHMGHAFYHFLVQYIGVTPYQRLVNLNQTGTLLDTV